MEYMYVITTYYDGELYNTHRIADFTDAAQLWALCKDHGNAKEYATYNLTDPTGKMYTKNFYTDGRVSIKQATMLVMDYRMVDVLNANQLEENDLIGIAESVVKIISITPTKEGFILIHEDEYGEKDVLEIFDDEQFELFILE